MNAISHRCTRGNGKPKRKKCAYCGGSLLVSEGVWGCFVWRGDGRYSLADALSTHGTEVAADRASAKDVDRYVTRFVTTT